MPTIRHQSESVLIEMEKASDIHFISGRRVLRSTGHLEYHPRTVRMASTPNRLDILSPARTPTASCAICCAHTPSNLPCPLMPACSNFSHVLTSPSVRCWSQAHSRATFSGALCGRIWESGSMAGCAMRSSSRALIWCVGLWGSVVLRARDRTASVLCSCSAHAARTTGNHREPQD